MHSSDMHEQISGFCAEAGSDPFLVQGAGGNVSWKTPDSLWVKASGTWLVDAKEQDIFVPVDLIHLRNAVASGDYAISPKVVGESALRPSIETVLHALMPQRIVVHFHCIDALAYLVRRDGRDQLQRKLPADLACAFVEYKKPGAELANAVHLAIEQSREGTNVLFLEKHGIVIGGETLDEITGLLVTLSKALRTESHPLVAIPGQTTVRAPEGMVAVDDVGVQQLALNPLYASRIRRDWALYPDHVVFLGVEAKHYASMDALRLDPDHVRHSLVFIDGDGVFARQPGKAFIAQLRCYHDVISRIPFDVPLAPLSHEDISALLDWEAEKYRQSKQF
jgi:ribulose-5-phosphate 4-epimerase/fuculose-1-phosphate aldolase